MQFVGVRLSLNGVTQLQLESLFKLIQKEKSPITISRFSDKRFAFTRADLKLNGNFTYEFLHNLSRIFPRTLSITVDIADSPDLANLISQFSVLEWKLDNIIYLGTTVIDTTLLRKIIPVDDNMDFLKLLFFTPAVTHLKNYLITKPKGLVMINETSLEIMLPLQRVDFIYLWLSRIVNNEHVDIDWLTGTSGELSEELIIGQGLSTEFQQNFDKWLETARSHQIDDFNLSYRPVLSVFS